MVFDQCMIIQNNKVELKWIQKKLLMTGVLSTLLLLENMYRGSMIDPC